VPKPSSAHAQARAERTPELLCDSVRNHSLELDAAEADALDEA